MSRRRMGFASYYSNDVKEREGIFDSIDLQIGLREYIQAAISRSSRL